MVQLHSGKQTYAYKYILAHRNKASNRVITQHYIPKPKAFKPKKLLSMCQRSSLFYQMVNELMSQVGPLPSNLKNAEQSYTPSEAQIQEMILSPSLRLQKSLLVTCLVRAYLIRNVLNIMIARVSAEMGMASDRQRVIPSA